MLTEGNTADLDDDSSLSLDAAPAPTDESIDYQEIFGQSDSADDDQAQDVDWPENLLDEAPPFNAEVEAPSETSFDHSEATEIEDRIQIDDRLELDSDDGLEESRIENWIDLNEAEAVLEVATEAFELPSELHGDTSESLDHASMCEYDSVVADDSVATDSSATPLVNSVADSDGDHDAEDSINAYMSDLLHRLRGDDSAPQIGAVCHLPKKPAEKSPAATERVLKSAFKTELANRQRELGSVEYIHRAAPEKMENLQTFRDVANTTARHAIDRSRRKKNDLPVLYLAGGGAASAAAGIGLLATATSVMGGYGLVGLGLALIAGGGGYRLFSGRVGKSMDENGEKEAPEVENSTAKSSTLDVPGIKPAV